MNNSFYNIEIMKGKYKPKILFYYIKDWKAYNMPFHKHNQIELMYVDKGQCKVCTQNKSFTLTKGQLIFLDANVAHNLIVDLNCRMVNIEFGFEFTNDENINLGAFTKNISIVQSFLKAKYPYYYIKEGKDIYEIMKNIIIEKEQKLEDRDSMITLLIFQLLIDISRRIIEDEKWGTESKNIYAQKAIKYMHDNYSSEILVNDIANYVNIHPNYLHRIFKEVIGITLMEYLQKIRIKKAEMLLTYTNISITEMALEVGFTSQQYFSYVFNKVKGVSPIKYRKQYSKVEYEK